MVFVCSAYDTSEKGIKLLKDMSWKSQSLDLPSDITPNELSLRWWDTGKVEKK